MPRWLHFTLGLVTLLVLAVEVPGTVVRRLPDGWRPGSPWIYEAWVWIVAVAFVALVVRAATGGPR